MVEVASSRGIPALFATVDRLINLETGHEINPVLLRRYASFNNSCNGHFSRRGDGA
jgi:hypothetical protein